MLLFWHTQSESKELRTNIFLIQFRRLSKSRESLCRFSHWKFGYYTQKLWSLNNSWTSRSLRQNQTKSHLLLGLNKGPAFPHCPAMPINKKEDPSCILGFHLYLQACIQESCNFTASERGARRAGLSCGPLPGLVFGCSVLCCNLLPGLQAGLGWPVPQAGSPLGSTQEAGASTICFVEGDNQEVDSRWKHKRKQLFIDRFETQRVFRQFTLFLLKLLMWKKVYLSGK